MMMNDSFKTEQELFEHLITGGYIRPHFDSEKIDKKDWIYLKGGNRVYLMSGESASNCLMSLGYWIRGEL